MVDWGHSRTPQCSSYSSLSGQDITGTTLGAPTPNPTATTDLGVEGTLAWGSLIFRPRPLKPVPLRLIWFTSAPRLFLRPESLIQ